MTMIVPELSTFFIDCEFDGHDGPLLSIALVRANGRNLYVTVESEVRDHWVMENVLPILDSHQAENTCHVQPNEVGLVRRAFIGECDAPTIISDSPVDIGRFCRAISTSPAGNWTSSGYRRMSFVVENVECYPSPLSDAVQHNSW